MAGSGLSTGNTTQTPYDPTKDPNSPQYDPTTYNGLNPGDPGYDPLSDSRMQYLFASPGRGARTLSRQYGINPFSSNPFADFLQNQLQAAYTRAMYGNPTFDSANLDQIAKTQFQTQRGAFDTGALSNAINDQGIIRNDPTHFFAQSLNGNPNSIAEGLTSLALQDPQNAFTYVRSLVSGAPQILQQALANAYNMLYSSYEDNAGTPGQGNKSFLEWLFGR